MATMWDLLIRHSEELCFHYAQLSTPKYNQQLELFTVGVHFFYKDSRINSLLILFSSPKYSNLNFIVFLLMVGVVTSHHLSYHENFRESRLSGNIYNAYQHILSK